MTDSPMNKAPWLEVRGVAFRHGREAALEDISLKFWPGRHYILAGPNGAGKSTLLDLLAGLKKPAQGRIMVRGKPTSEYEAPELARLLARRAEVSILFTGPVLHKSPGHWRNYYAKMKIDFSAIAPEETEQYSNVDVFRDRSLAVYKKLREKDFDFIHFQDWQANAFHCIQAKRVLGDFERTLLTVTMHSNTEWINEGMRQWNSDPLLMTKLAWMERYCHQHCDLLLSPSQYMFDWAEARGWELNPQRLVMPNCLIEAGNEKPCAPVDPSHLVFFGRLETRKGLEMFCSAILNAAPKIKKLTFLGVHGLVQGQNSARHLADFIKRVPQYEIHIEAGADSFQALDYLRQSGAVAVIPSLADNFPYTVVECVQSGLPFIAAGCGGIGEIAGEAALFPPTVKGLSTMLERLPDMDFASVKHPYNAAVNHKRWLDFHRAAPAHPLPPPVGTANTEPLISICIPYYNYGRYLGQLLDSIRNGLYRNYEVIVINDGSTDEYSIEVFERLREQYAGDGRWRFMSKTNGGIGQTRNMAAGMAAGEYLVFMDADNCAYPDALSVMAQAAIRSGADCLTCHFTAFVGDEVPGVGTVIEHRYVPYGSCLEAGLCENVFGDANFIIKKSVFQNLGGFDENRELSWEDYEFLARLCLSGFSLDVIPRPLFWYRVTSGGFSRITGAWLNHRRISELYGRGLPPHVRRIFEELAIPYSQAALSKGSVFNFLYRRLARWLPEGSRRRRAARYVYLLLHRKGLL